MNYGGKSMATNFEPLKCVIFAQSTKICTQENIAFRSILLLSCCLIKLIGFGMDMNIEIL